MANMFSIMLASATLITGIIWCYQRLEWLHAYRDKTVTDNIDNTKLVIVAKHVAGWVDNTASVFPLLLLVFVVRSFIYEPFQIPSASMMPTLLIGDFILVEKYAYGIKDPITQTTLINTGHPRRGDIAVFKYPLNPKLDYIKRVIGLQGDRITYDPMDNRLAVQPSCEGGQSCDKPFVVTYNNVQPSDFVQLFSHSGVSEGSNGLYQIPLSQNVPQNGIRLRARQETLGDVTHSILSVPGTREQVIYYYKQPGQPLAEWVVPAGHYFMMGDNRDNSADSRYWGFVQEKYLVGKAIGIWMSFEKQEGEWPTGVRFSRVGGIH
ncbi:Signal peptidase I [Serratia symbiotica]|nr:Signal peptidase I [Serratia symbiotica]